MAQSESASESKQPKKLNKYLSQLIVIVVAAAIFLFGWAVGSERINFGHVSVFRKSVQKDLPADLEYTSVEEAYDKLKASFDGDLDQQKLLDGLKQGLAKSSGDPYTEYLNEEQAREFDEEISGSFTGIGAELSKEENAISVVAPIAGYPAEKAGLRAKDIIVEIDGKTAYDLTLTEAVKRIRGPKDTKVTLKIVRGSKEELTIEIVRDQINIPSVESKILDNNIGYMKISRYGKDTVDLSEQAAANFKKAGVKGVIMDLRNNPGGLLDASVDVSGLWLKNEVVLTERRGDTVVKTYRSNGSAPLAGVPTVVLVNEGSASASEITAGALKDHGAATLIGTKTFGKGSVQSLENLKEGGVLKVTIARWYTPNGRNIDAEGIEPDQKVERSDEDIKTQRDPQLDAATAKLAR